MTAARYTPPAPPSTIPMSARQIVQRAMDEAGVSGLTNWAWGQYVKLGGGQGALDAIQAELPDQAEFKARYPAYAALAKQGTPWTVSQIQQYEQSARDSLNTVGLAHAYGNDELQQMLIGGVSLNELNQRVNVAQAAASAPHETTDALKRLYGLNGQQLAGYWFDPARSLTTIQNQWLAGQTAGSSVVAGYGDLTRPEAEMLAADGVTGQSGQNALTQLAQEKGLYTQQAGEDTVLTRQQQLGTLTGNADALTAFQQRQAARKAQFAGAGGFSAGQKGIVGLADSTV